MFKKAAMAVIILGIIVLAGLEIPAWAQHRGTPSVLSIRERAFFLAGRQTSFHLIK
ncbi:MAG: hypothetical protein NT006_07475 [Candidatus Aminicenantes bacterium]|nr:hypothetical protein [Candidatus Aminicenantes bacterium]